MAENNIHQFDFGLIEVQVAAMVAAYMEIGVPETTAIQLVNRDTRYQTIEQAAREVVNTYFDEKSTGLYPAILRLQKVLREGK